MSTNEKKIQFSIVQQLRSQAQTPEMILICSLKTIKMLK